MIPPNLERIPLLPLGLGLGGMALLASSLALFVRIRRLRRKAEQARSSWHCVPAKMVYSRVEKSFDRDGSSYQVPAYSARFLYEYTVDHQRYEGTKYSLVGDWSSSDPEPHQKELRGFPEGADVMVWVNPIDPSESVLRLDDSAFPDATLLHFFS